MCAYCGTVHGAVSVRGTDGFLQPDRFLLDDLIAALSTTDVSILAGCTVPRPRNQRFAEAALAQQIEARIAGLGRWV